MAARQTIKRDPPTPVMILGVEGHWFPGELDTWVLEDDGEWYGQATLFRTGCRNWYDARMLRPRPAEHNDDDSPTTDRRIGLP